MKSEQEILTAIEINKACIDLAMARGDEESGMAMFAAVQVLEWVIGVDGPHRGGRAFKAKINDLVQKYKDATPETIAKEMAD